MAIDRLRGIALGAPGLPGQADFFVRNWGLGLVERRDGVAYLRGSAAEHHILALHDRPIRGVVAIEFGAPDAAAIDHLHRHLTGFGVTDLTPPTALDGPGGGYGLSFRDPDRHLVRVSAGVVPHADTADTVEGPRKISHVVFNTPDMDRLGAFYQSALGFKISDWSEDVMVFLRCNNDHHCLALVRATHASINHIAYEMCSVHAYMRGQGRMKAAGSPAAWGPGRHGPGNNPFAYFVVPGNFVFEYTCELQQIDEATHEPKVWQRTPEQSDLWGTAGPPTPAIRAAMAGNPDPDWLGV